MSYTNSGLSEDKRLVWAGLKQPQQDQSPIQRFVNTLEEEVDFGSFQSAVLEDISDYSGLQSYFEDNGFDADKAEDFVDHIENDYPEFADFEDFVDSINSYSAFINGFGTTATFSGEAVTEDGDDLAAIRIHDDGGISQNGVVLPEGTVEVIGRRIEFSQSGPIRAEDGEVTFSNLTTDSNDNVETNLSTVEISVDVSNSNSGARLVSVALTRDGSVVDEQNVEVPATSTETVTFTESHSDVCYDYEIETEGPVTVCWVHPGLVM